MGFKISDLRIVLDKNRVIEQKQGAINSLDREIDKRIAKIDVLKEEESKVRNGTSGIAEECIRIARAQGALEVQKQWDAWREKHGIDGVGCRNLDPGDWVEWTTDDEEELEGVVVKETAAFIGGEKMYLVRLNKDRYEKVLSSKLNYVPPKYGG